MQNPQLSLTVLEGEKSKVRAPAGCVSLLPPVVQEKIMLGQGVWRGENFFFFFFLVRHSAHYPKENSTKPGSRACPQPAVRAEG